ncbi:MAG: hypothetical protein KatS3mg077_3288 [Candidatus Binatia bacterium]|nr:MAG: hypothetical protein KatS3mg077_3288 [Candidatus Binatia bacterium]
MCNPRAHLPEYNPRWAGLPEIVVTPAFKAPIATNAARVTRTRAHLRERACRRTRLAILVGTPAFDRAIAAKSAGVLPTGTHLSERPDSNSDSPYKL